MAGGEPSRSSPLWRRSFPSSPPPAVGGGPPPHPRAPPPPFQAELRRIPSGDPDEETFAQLARDCREERSVAFPDRQGVEAVAGNVGPGDDEIFAPGGGRGRGHHLGG